MDIPLLLGRLEAAYPDAGCTLCWSTPWELVVATILSAQCTDERVNRVTMGVSEPEAQPSRPLQEKRFVALGPPEVDR